MYPEATLHDVESKVHYADKGKVSIISWSTILIFPVIMYQVHFVSSELCDKLQKFTGMQMLTQMRL